MHGLFYFSIFGLSLNLLDINHFHISFLDFSLPSLESNLAKGKQSSLLLFLLISASEDPMTPKFYQQFCCKPSFPFCLFNFLLLTENSQIPIMFFFLLQAKFLTYPGGNKRFPRKIGLLFPFKTDKQTKSQKVTWLVLGMALDIKTLFFSQKFY